MKTVYSVAKKILRPKLPQIRAYAREYPRPTPPDIRHSPTAADLWRRYLIAMSTAQTRSNGLVGKLAGDARWRALRSGGPASCPSVLALERLLRSLQIRFPRQKAERIRRAAARDFDGLARIVRDALRGAHDRGARRWTLRREELRVSEALQTELSGCGVAPKIARLMLTGTDEFEHLVPIDSRWMAALEAAGASVRPEGIAQEPAYRFVEDQIADAAYDLGILPVLADGAVFGWIDTSDEEVTS